MQQDTRQLDQNQLAAGAPAAAPPQAPIEYDTVVSTGDKFGAGTDALISMTVRGSAGTATHTFDQVGWDGS